MYDTLALCDRIAAQLELEHSTDTLALCERIVADIEARERLAYQANAQAAWHRYAAAVRLGRGKAA